MRHPHQRVEVRESINRIASLAALALAGSVAGWAQAGPARDQAQVKVNENVKTQDAISKPESAKKPNGEGIQVHGHWTIEVRDPDGTLRTHRDFENALAVGAGNGGNLLAFLLLGTGTPGGFGIQLQGPNKLSLNIVPQFPHCNGVGCNLIVTPIPGGFTLSGSTTSASAAFITDVLTYIFWCANSVAPSGCTDATTAASNFLTSKDLSAAPIQVAAGQTVSASVQITFM